MRIIENQPINTAVWFLDSDVTGRLSGSLIQTSLSGVGDQRRRLKFRLASGPNAFSLRLPVPSGLKVAKWRPRLHGYHDTKLCDFLEFGWPIAYVAPSPPTSTYRNHESQPDIIKSYLDKECALDATCGPFTVNPLNRNLTVSPLQIALYSSFTRHRRFRHHHPRKRRRLPSIQESPRFTA